jgi:hypothetical protein
MLSHSSVTYSVNLTVTLPQHIIMIGVRGKEHFRPVFQLLLLMLSTAAFISL